MNTPDRINELHRISRAAAAAKKAADAERVVTYDDLIAQDEKAALVLFEETL